MKYRLLTCLLIFGILSCMMMWNACQTRNADKKELIGERLFSDVQLSWNHTRSCASCHDPSMAFTDGYRTSVSPSGEMLLHNAPSLLHVSKMKVFDWANPKAKNLAQQLQRPLYGTHPLELGLHLHWPKFLSYIRDDSAYQSLLLQTYGKIPPPADSLWVVDCLIAYINTLQSGVSPFDRFLKGDSSALSQDALAGYQLFCSDSLACVSCHGGPDLSNATLTKNHDSIYFNTGLYFTSAGTYPPQDDGLRLYTQQAQDDGKFRVPSLRNVMRTPPYMHDGSMSSIEDVISHYSRSGRLTTKGPNQGDGRFHPFKSKYLNGFSLSRTQELQLIEFLYHLNDEDHTMSKSPNKKTPQKLSGLACPTFQSYD
jgi:cytochrome c peroxidase